MANSFYPGVGIDRETGQVISGWVHVRQCLSVIFTTSFGDRVIREWFGSAVPMLLGENVTESTFLAYFSAICASIDFWEPRFRITQITPTSVDRLGRVVITMQGEYMPRGHLGDKTVEYVRSIRAFGVPRSMWNVIDS